MVLRAYPRALWAHGARNVISGKSVRELAGSVGVGKSRVTDGSQ